MAGLAPPPDAELDDPALVAGLDRARLRRVLRRRHAGGALVLVLVRIEDAVKNMFATLRRSVALICATMLVSARDLRAAENNATDVVTAAKLFESYLDGKMEMEKKP
jgi:hypothetical protein